jgi:hypothetical protein
VASTSRCSWTHELSFHETLGTKGVDESGRWYLKGRSGADLHRDTGEWYDVTQIKNRRTDHYVKKIINSAGEIIRDDDERLSEHVPTAVKRRRLEQQND